MPEQQEAEMREEKDAFPEEVIAEAEMLGFSSVEELQDKIKQGMPTKNYDTSALIHQASEALDGNYKQGKSFGKQIRKVYQKKHSMNSQMLG